MTTVPVIDITALIEHGVESAEAEGAVKAIGDACEKVGFFYVSGHGIPLDLQETLHNSARDFFAQDDSVKSQISMDKGGKAWRGWFPAGGELTNGRPDLKEGIYFGTEQDDDVDPRPLHGRNQFPVTPSQLGPAVLEYMQHCTLLGQILMSAVAVALGIQPKHYAAAFTPPTTLFRIFSYPPPSETTEQVYGVQEHTDYGYITLLKQDTCGGLQVKCLDGKWIDAPPIDNTLVVNLGDALEHNTGGLLRATPHRVLNQSGKHRLSFPFFFDPNFDAKLTSVLPLLSPELQERAALARDAIRERWDGQRPELFEGTYGEYLLAKVGKVFPQLKEDHLEKKEGSVAV